MPYTQPVLHGLLPTVVMRPPVDPQPAVTVHSAPTGPESLPLYDDFTVDVNGQQAPVYMVQYATTHVYSRGIDPPTAPAGYASFDLAEGAATVVVKVKNRPLTSARVVPSRYNITPQVAGDSVRFVLPRPGHYELQINGSEANPLHISVNPEEVAVPPAAGGDGITYYRPGRVTKAGKFHYFGPGVYTLNPQNWQLGSDETVYIAGGAVVRGRFAGDNPGGSPPNSVRPPRRSNVTIRGRGIIDTSDVTTLTGSPIYLHDFDGVTVEGITLYNSSGWSNKLFHCRNILYDNVKVFGWRRNTDGIHLTCCQRFEIRNCFIRNWDDGIILHAEGDANDANQAAFPSPRLYADAENNIHTGYVHDNVLCGDLGIGALEVGMETICNEIRDVVYENNDIVHAHYKSAIGLHTSQMAVISNFTYRNIWIEDHKGSDVEKTTFNFTVEPASTGAIREITLENIFVNGSVLPSKMRALPPPNDIRGVTFKNLRMNGTLAESTQAARFAVMSNASDVRFIP